VVIKLNPSQHGKECTVQFDDGDKIKMAKLMTIKCINDYENSTKLYPDPAAAAHKKSSESSASKRSTVSVPAVNTTHHRLARSPSPTTAARAAGKRPMGATGGGSRAAKRSVAAMATSAANPTFTFVTPQHKRSSVDAAAALSSGSVSDLREALESEMARADAAENQVKALLIKLKAVSEVGAMLCDTVNSALVAH
jgi:hypothetical protein